MVDMAKIAAVRSVCESSDGRDAEAGGSAQGSPREDLVEQRDTYSCANLNDQLISGLSQRRQDLPVRISIVVRLG